MHDNENIIAAIVLRAAFRSQRRECEFKHTESAVYDIADEPLETYDGKGFHDAG